MLSQKGRDLQFILRTLGNANVTLTTTSLPLGSMAARYHVVATYKPNSDGTYGGMRIYVNSVQQAANTESGTLPVNGTNAWKGDFILAIGNKPGLLDRDWSGKMHLAAVYNRVLTPEQVRNNFNAGVPERFAIESVPLGVTSLTRVLPFGNPLGSRSLVGGRDRNGIGLEHGRTLPWVRRDRNAPGQCGLLLHAV